MSNSGQRKTEELKRVQGTIESHSVLNWEDALEIVNVHAGSQGDTIGSCSTTRTAEMIRNWSGLNSRRLFFVFTATVET